MSEIDWNERLLNSSNGDRAALRRCVGKTLNQADADALRVFYSTLPINTSSWKQERYFAVMCLSCLWKLEEALNPKPFEQCIHDCVDPARSNGIYARVRSILDTEWDDDDGYLLIKLARMAKLIKNNDRPLYPDFAKLLYDLFNWNENNRKVQRRWAEVIFEGIKKNEDNEDNENNESEEN
ncbi:MAG: hypothetical protein GX802_03160 [Clostridiales bacterium]|jgi:CRISPR type I-E-associated protein CasB/Cse2|nr:hypothetical protein [Clostridiales bacterium]